MFTAGLLGGYTGSSTSLDGSGARTPRRGRQRQGYASVRNKLPSTSCATPSRRLPIPRSSSSLDLDGTIVASTAIEHEGVSQATAVVLRARRIRDVRSTRADPRAHREAHYRDRHTALRPRRTAHRSRRRVPQPRAHRPDRPATDRPRRHGRDVRRRCGPADTCTPRSSSDEALASTGINRALAAEDGSGLYDNHRSVPVIGVYQWLPEIGAAPHGRAEPERGVRTCAAARVRDGRCRAPGPRASRRRASTIASRRIARPILAITDTARAVAAGDLTREAPVLTEDEVGELAGTFNDMTAQLRENVETLEHRVEERTAELANALRDARRRPRSATGGSSRSFRSSSIRTGRTPPARRRTSALRSSKPSAIRPRPGWRSRSSLLSSIPRIGSLVSTARSATSSPDRNAGRSSTGHRRGRADRVGPGRRLDRPRRGRYGDSMSRVS